MSRTIDLSYFKVPDLNTAPRYGMVAATALLATAIGIVDFSTTEISFGVAYLLPIIAGAWWIGLRYAIFLSIYCVGMWLYGDLYNGIAYSNAFASVWNYSFRLIFYIVAVFFIVRLKNLQNELGQRVNDRTAALTREISERERLERELLDISEREQRRIGQDLHDGLCQHLTGTALTGQVLAEDLEARSLREPATRTRKIVDLIEEAISLARNLAKGLHPVDMQADGLITALDDFARTTSDLFKVSCTFECDSPVLIHDSVVAIHLYRIAQEAVGNAIRHGQAPHIRIQLEAHEDGASLRIVDDGVGLSDPLPKKGGIGLQIMAHRAKVIGAQFHVRSKPHEFMEITCFLPNERLTQSIDNARA